MTGQRYVFDIETDGLLPELTTIHCLVLKDLDTGEVFSYTPNDISEGVNLLANASLIVGHNIIAFDLPAIQKVYPDFATKAMIRDTLILTRLFWADIKDKDFTRKRDVFPGQMIGRYSLESFGYRLGLWKGDYAKVKEAEAKAEGISDKAAITRYVWGTWNQEMQDYCEQDVEVTERLWTFCEQEREARNWSDECIDTEHRVAQIIFRQEQHGVFFDEEEAVKLYSKLVKRRSEIERELKEAFPPWWKSRGVFTPKRDNKRMGYAEDCPLTKIELVEFNPGSRFDVADRLKTLRGWKPKEFTGDGHAKVDEKVLGQLPYPEAKLLSEFFVLNKIIGYLAEGKQAWLKHVRSTGRIHAGVISCGAVSGRMTHREPNLGNVPSSKALYGKDCRKLFKVPRGRKLVGCDAEGLELRALAGYMALHDGGAYIQTVLEGDKTRGTDMHSVNCRALGLDPTTEYPIDGKMISGRDIAKTWFYAFIYGAGDFKLGSIMGIRGSKQKITGAGKKSRSSFLTSLPALGKITEQVRKRVKKRGRLKGLDGRWVKVRSEHAALNFLLQSCGAIIMKKALVILDDDLQEAGYIPGRDYEFVLNVHDEFQIEVYDPGQAEFIGETAKESIRKAGEYYYFACPLAGAYDVGETWAETH